LEERGIPPAGLLGEEMEGTFLAGEEGRSLSTKQRSRGGHLPKSASKIERKEKRKGKRRNHQKPKGSGRRERGRKNGCG